MNYSELSDLAVGQIITKPYPFKFWENEHGSGWAGGCHLHYEDGPAVYNGQCLQEAFYTADGEGEISYEILALVEMPRKYKNRVIYCISMTWPCGAKKKSSKCYTATESKFLEWVSSGYSSYPFDYEINDSLPTATGD